MKKIVYLLLAFLLLVSCSWESVVSKKYDIISDLRISSAWNLAYVVNTSNWQKIIKDWVEWGDYDSILLLENCFSKDGKDFFYIWTKWWEDYVVENGVEKNVWKWSYSTNSWVDNFKYFNKSVLSEDDIVQIHSNYDINKKWDKVEIDWYPDRKVKINWDTKYNFPHEYISYSLKLSDSWDSYAFIWKKEYENFIIKDWEKLDFWWKYKDFENIVYSPWSNEITFLAKTTDGNYDSVIVKEWKDISKKYTKIRYFKYAPDWKKLYYVWRESWEQFVVEVK